MKKYRQDFASRSAQFVKRILKRIEFLKSQVHHSEADVVHAIVVPLLKFWGWHPDNPAQVRYEVPLDETMRKRADIVLFAPSGIPVAILEVKRLTENPRDAIAQLYEYAGMYTHKYGNKGSDIWLIITNGERWWKRDYPRGQTREETYEMKGTNISQITQEFLHFFWFLARIHHTSQKGFQKPGGEKDTAIDDRALHPDSLLVINHERAPEQCTGKKPEMLIFPAGKRVEVKHWIDVAKRIIRFYLNQIEAKEVIPVLTSRTPETSRGGCLLNNKPEHLNGFRFRKPYELRKNLWMEENLSCREVITGLQNLLKNLGLLNIEFWKILLK